MQSLITMIFFPFYIVFQAPMVLLARKLRPRRFISAIVSAWGIITIAQGLVNNWWSLLPLRACLGILEAGFFSSSVYILSTWYIRRKCTEG